MRHDSIQVTVNSTKPNEEGNFSLRHLTLDEALKLMIDNAPNWTSIVLIVIK